METQHDWFDAEEILTGIVNWASIESPTYHAAGVNAVLDLAEREMTEMGGRVARSAGIRGFGDILTAGFPGGSHAEGAGILVLCHVDTVHTIGTLESRLPIRRDGDRLFGPGVLDMKGGGRLAIEAFKAIARANLKTRLPVTFMFTPDEEIGSPTSRQAIEAEAVKHHYVLVPEPLRPSGDVVVGRHAIQRFNVRTIGQPSHAGLNKRDSRSAIAEMARLIERIEALNDFDRGNDLLRRHRARWHLRQRRRDGVRGAGAVRLPRLTKSLPNCARRCMPWPARYMACVSRSSRRWCAPIAPPHPGTMALFDTAGSIAADLDITLTHCLSGGGSDGNFTGALGLPTLDGLGVAGAGAHTFGEHLLVPSLVPRTCILSELLLTLDSP